MRIASIVFMFLASMLGLVAPGASQSGGWGTGSGIPGYLDPRTGEFHVKPAPPAVGPQSIFPNVATTGTLIYKFTITISSTDITTAEQIACMSTNDVFDSSGRTFDEQKTVAATRTGSTATCTITVPYSWALSSASTDMISQDVNVTVPYSAITLPLRLSDQTLASIKVPASGTKTTTNVAFTI
jgi:hypothetical protein